MNHPLEILIITERVFHLGEKHLEQILKTIPQVSLTVAEKEEVTDEMLGKAEIIFGWPKAEKLKEAKNLKWLHLLSAGANEYANKEIYYNKEIQLTNSSGVFGLPIAEHVFSMILA
jgi:phosphoglycerate dehydrogenase-like enzyme